MISSVSKSSVASWRRLSTSGSSAVGVGGVVGCAVDPCHATCDR
jgi:Na+/alanine symporter